MKITIEIDDKYKGILKEIAANSWIETIDQLVYHEIMEIIKENTNDYGYDEDGNKIHTTEDGDIYFEDIALNHDQNKDDRTHYNQTIGR